MLLSQMFYINIEYGKREKCCKKNSRHNGHTWEGQLMQTSTKCQSLDDPFEDEKVDQSGIRKVDCFSTRNGKCKDDRE